MKRWKVYSCSREADKRSDKGLQEEIKTPDNRVGKMENNIKLLDNNWEEWNIKKDNHCLNDAHTGVDVKETTARVKLHTFDGKTSWYNYRKEFEATARPNCCTS